MPKIHSPESSSLSIVPDLSNASLRILAIALFSALLLFPAVAEAQLDRGSIRGTVTDTSGAAVEGARIQLINLNTGVQSVTLSNKAGQYVIPNIPAGSYKAVYSGKGFRTLERLGILLFVGQTAYVNATLEVGQITETITVKADADLLKYGYPLLATNIQGSVVRNLPLTFEGGRQIESFAYALAPTADGDSWTSHISGTPAFTKEVLIDGQSATSQIQGNVMESSPAMDSIQEFSVQTGAASAEYGRTAGGIFSFTLKQGTNTPHGSAFYYGRNEALDANTWMNNWQLSQDPGNPSYQRARDRQLIVGGSAGGPIVIPGVYNGKNRTFLFGAFEYYRQQRLQTGSMNRTVPIPEFLEGDFSRLLTTTQIGTDALDRPVYAGQIYDPASMRQIGTQWVADPFEGNIIPAERMSAVSRKIIDIYKAEYQPLIAGRLTNNSAGPQNETPWIHQTQLSLKGDHAFSPDLKLAGSLIWTARPRILADEGGIWNPSAAGNDGGPLAKSRKQDVTARSLRLALNWNPRSSLSHTTAFVYNRYRNPSISAQAGGDWNKYLGLQNSTSAGLFPEISFGSDVNGIGTTSIGYGDSGYYVANTYIVSDAMEWAHGRHRFKFGGEFWAQQMNSHSGLDTLSVDFLPTQTGIPGYSWSNRVGFGFASFFLGEAGGGSKSVPFDLYGRRKYLAFFFQDNYRFNESLSFNLGMRWEQSQPLHEKYGRWANFDSHIRNTALNVAGALEFADSSQSTFEKKRDWKEFGPRAGVSYRMGDRLVAHAGYGLSFIPLGLNYWSGVPYGFAPGYRGTNTQTESPNLPRFNWDSGYPDHYQAPAKDPNALVYGMVSVDERSLFAGYIHQYNAGVQFEAAKDMVVEIAFMGNQGRRLHNGALRRNQPSREAYENSSVDPWAWVWDEESASAAGVSYPYSGFSNYAGIALQPYPQVAAETYGPLYSVGTPLGASGYKSLQVSFTRRMSRGIAAQVSYTWSRALGNSETGFDEAWDVAGGIQDAYNLSESSNTVLSYDQTHVIKGYVALELPFGRGRKFLSNLHPALNGILGGWELTGLFRYNSGKPLGVSTSVWYPGWEGAVYADYDSSVDLSRQFNGSNFNPALSSDKHNRYFNAEAFSDPQGHKLGNGKRLYSRLRGFGYAGEDFCLMKNFPVQDRAVIQMRAEFLNAFNRHYFADPNTKLADASTFGYVTSLQGSPRIIQFGIRVDW